MSTSSSKMRLYRWGEILVVERNPRNARARIRNDAGYGPREVSGLREVRRSVELIYDRTCDKRAVYTPREVVAIYPTGGVILAGE